MEFRPSCIVMHCSATEDGKTVDWQAIRRWHTGQHPDSPYKENPMRDIGYHFGIEYLNAFPEILIGRLPNTPGAHVRSHNNYTLGVCIVGNFDLYPPAEIVWQKAVGLVCWLVQQFAIKEIVGHRELDDKKSCPGLMFDMAAFRMEVRDACRSKSRLG